jgi:hypothetical protein
VTNIVDAMNNRLVAIWRIARGSFEQSKLERIANAPYGFDSLTFFSRQNRNALPRKDAKSI